MFRWNTQKYLHNSSLTNVSQQVFSNFSNNAPDIKFSQIRLSNTIIKQSGSSLGDPLNEFTSSLMKPKLIWLILQINLSLIDSDSFHGVKIRFAKSI